MAKIKYTGEEALARVADYVNKKLTFVSSMPESPDTNTLVLYIGADTSAYLQGGIYFFDGTNWNLINSVQTIELTKAEYDALPKEVQENGTIYFITDLDLPGSIVEGYYNPIDGKFYVEDTYTTEIAGGLKIIYISLDTNMEYRYDIDEEKFIQIAGSGSSAEYTAGRGIKIINREISVDDKIKNTVNEVTENNMNSVTSNAVYNAIQNIGGGVGKQLEESSTVYIDDQGTTATVGNNAEIFNDYRERGSSDLNGNIAIGNWSHAEGYQNTAIGDNSHAEGSQTTAKGPCSHTEGNATIAEGTFAHAEARQTQAIGHYSHAEGEYSKAKGVTSHAEGWTTNAIGDYSHTEGYQTTAEKINSHAEGRETQSTGENSHAEGYKTIASGNHSHAEGSQTTAIGTYSHSEGGGTIAKGTYSHSEGSNTNAEGSYSHAEGYSTSATKTCSHAEGDRTESTGSAAHTEGCLTKASASNAHAEGISTNAIANCAHAEGNSTNANGIGSHAEGSSSTASSDYSHAEGGGTKAIGNYSHVEGSYTETNGRTAHAEGYETKAYADYSHAEGYQTETIGKYSHVEGYKAKITKDFSHVEGFNTEANEEHTHTEGFYTVAAGKNQHVQGHYNKKSTSGSTSGTTGDAFIIGNGSSTPGSNCFRVTFAGAVYGLSAFNSSGADYAEFFEWKDGNPDSEDRVGYFVTLNEDKIIKANEGDYILGVVSGHPSIVGNGDEDWLGRYIRDDFGRTIEEDIIDEETNEIIGKKFKQNPNYDTNQEYIERKDRKEWDYVGMLGTLAVRDDGTCKVNGFCTVTDGGIATKSNEGYRVIKRISNNIIQIIFK